MSPEELDSLVNDIEENMKKDLVLIKGFQTEDFQGDRRAKKVLALKILCLLNVARFFILSFLCLFPSNKTSTHFKVIFIDTLFPFGSFGCLSNQIFALGFTFALSFPYVMHEAEKNGQLQIISHIKDHREFRLTSVETIKFAMYLKWMKTLRILFVYVVAPLVISFLALGACLSSLEMQSMTFTAASIFVSLINCTQMYYAAVWSPYVYMMPVHSNNILSIQFNRLFDRIESLQKSHNLIDWNLNLDSETREEELPVKLHKWLKQAQQLVKERQSVLTIIENLLRQIEQHNETVKHILDNGSSCLVPAIGLAIVFCAGERGDLLRHMFSAGVGFGGLVYYVSMFKTHNIYTLSLKLSSNLHGMQARLEGKGMKSQLQILRLIQRTSDCESWHHSIGFTVGNRESLSQKLVLSSFFHTLTIALTFLNAKSAWKQ